MLVAVTTATGGLRTRAHTLHRLHVAQIWSQPRLARQSQLPQTQGQPQICSVTSTRCLSTTSGELALGPRDSGTCPAEITPVIGFKEGVNPRKKAVTPPTEVAGVKLKICRYSPQPAREAQGKKAEAVGSKIVKHEKRLKVASGEPLHLPFAKTWPDGYKDPPLNHLHSTLANLSYFSYKGNFKNQTQTKTVTTHTTKNSFTFRL